MSMRNWHKTQEQIHIRFEVQAAFVCLADSLQILVCISWCFGENGKSALLKLREKENNCS